MSDTHEQRQIEREKERQKRYDRYDKQRKNNPYRR